MLAVVLSLFLSLPCMAQDDDETIRELEAQRAQQALEMDKISTPLNVMQGESPATDTGENAPNNSLAMAADALNGVTPESIENGLRARLNHPIAKNFIERHPEVLQFVGQWYAGPEQAFTHFIKIIDQKEKLKTYAFTALAIFIIGQILGAFPPKKGLFTRLLYKLFLTILTFCVFLGAFGYIFQTEMAPTYVVAKRVFLKNKSFF